jgi:hypothetical protein
MKCLRSFSIWVGILGLAWMATSCAVTNTATQSIHDTAEVSTDTTSSTSGGDADASASQREKAIAFADANFDRLRAEMAVGSGEHLSSLGFILGVVDEHQQAFFALTKDRFGSLFDADQTTAEQLMTRLELELAVHPHLIQ